MTRSRYLAPLALACVLAGCGSAAVEVANSARGLEPAAAATCRVNTENPAPGESTWLSNRAAQRANGRLQPEIDRTFGKPGSGKDPASRYLQLEHGLIGEVLSDADEEIVVVVDPALVDVSALDVRLKRVTGPNLAVRVQAGCFAAAELVEAGRVIDARAWHPQATHVAYAFSLRGENSSYTFDFADTPDGHAVGDALVARLGPRVTLNYNGGPVRD